MSEVFLCVAHQRTLGYYGVYWNKSVVKSSTPTHQVTAMICLRRRLVAAHHLPFPPPQLLCRQCVSANDTVQSFLAS